MTHHHTSIEHICKRQTTKQFRDSFVHAQILEFSFDFALEPVDHVDLFCLMVASGHVQELFVHAFPSNQSHNALHWEWASVYEISIEQIFISLRGVSIKFENIQQIVILTMYIPANCNFFLIFNLIVDQWVITDKNILALLYQLQGKSFMQRFLSFVMFHQVNHPIGSNIAVLGDSRPIVLFLYCDLFPTFVWFLFDWPSFFVIMKHLHFPFFEIFFMSLL